MSASALGDTAVCGKLVADQVQNVSQRQVIGSLEFSAAGALPTSGFHILAPAANPTAFTLPNGSKPGDVVEFLHKTGGNVAQIAPSVLHGAITRIDMTGGSHVKLVWSTNNEWYLINRCGDGAAAANAVQNYPTII
jgi:hypothetical protein